jgi:hypothetical protein
MATPLAMRGSARFGINFALGLPSHIFFHFVKGAQEFDWICEHWHIVR